MTRWPSHWQSAPNLGSPCSSCFAVTRTRWADGQVCQAISVEKIIKPRPSSRGWTSGRLRVYRNQHRTSNPAQRLARRMHRCHSEAPGLFAASLRRSWPRQRLAHRTCQQQGTHLANWCVPFSGPSGRKQDFASVCRRVRSSVLGSGQGAGKQGRLSRPIARDNLPIAGNHRGIIPECGRLPFIDRTFSPPVLAPLGAGPLVARVSRPPPPRGCRASF